MRSVKLQDILRISSVGVITIYNNNNNNLILLKYVVSLRSVIYKRRLVSVAVKLRARSARSN